MKCSQPYGAGNNFVLVVHDVDDLLTLVGVEGSLADEQGLVGPADRSPNAGEQPREEDLLLVGEHAPRPYGAGPRIDLVVNEIDGPLVWVAVFVGQPEGHGEPPVAGRV